MPTTTSKPVTSDRSSGEILPLVNRDRLTPDEFERRYAAMPHLKKTELVEETVYVPSPVNLLAGDTAPVMKGLGEGLASRRHGEFAGHLKKRLEQA
ncbi:MAG: hypothetical protein HYU36_09860 [Planctomycetes bacterium]|nr:hypothetical protein [Planctomycetota bacterium]